MTFLHHLCAHILSKHGAKVRKERERAKIHAVVDEMRARHGLPAVTWGRG